MVTAICNVFINSDIKFELFKETFPRVYGISNNWLINIRGKYHENCIKYVQDNFPDFRENCHFFPNLYDNDWAKSTRAMLENSKYDYIYVFLEDHFLLKPLDYFKDVIRDMIDSKVEYFMYSAFNIGLSVHSAEGLYPDYSKYFFHFQFDEKNITYLKENNSQFYPYSSVSICTKKYFEKILTIENKLLLKVPFLLQAFMEKNFFTYPKNRVFWFGVNKLVSYFGIRFVIYPPSTPFNTEKSLFDCDSKLLPLKVGCLMEELFANWDDDNGISNSSLIKRGLYPKHFIIDSKKNEPPLKKSYHLLCGKILKCQYYPDKPRITKIPLKYILVESGTLDIASSLENLSLSSGEYAWVAANIPHTITAREDCWYSVYITD